MTQRDGEEIERVIICCSEDDSIYPDNVHGKCAKCGCAIVWRPHNPEPSTKLCWECVDFNEVDSVTVTEETKREVREFLLKGRAASSRPPAAEGEEE